ncbi:MAG: hypothetical protein ACRDJF_04810 [Actinomycetota bacterium]
MPDILEGMAGFLRTHSGVEAVIRRIGTRSTQLILIGETGEWLRWVAPSTEEARDLCRKLEVEAHEYWPEHLRRRINSYRRSPEDWSAAPYPERQSRGST